MLTIGLIHRATILRRPEGVLSTAAVAAAGGAFDGAMLQEELGMQVCAGHAHMIAGAGQRAGLCLQSVSIAARACAAGWAAAAAAAAGAVHPGAVLASVAWPGVADPSSKQGAERGGEDAPEGCTSSMPVFALGVACHVPATTISVAIYSRSVDRF